MSRLAPIRSLISDHLQTKTTRVNQTETFAQCTDSYSPNEGIEYCGSPNDKTVFFFDKAQDFYEDRNRFSTYDEKEQYYSLRERIEVKNEFGDVIEIRKEKQDHITGSAPKNSYQEIGRRKKTGKGLIDEKVPAKKSILTKLEKSKMDWLTRPENKNIFNLFAQHDTETIEHAKLLNIQLPNNEQKGNADRETKAKNYERHCFAQQNDYDNENDSTLRNETLSFVYNLNDESNKHSTIDFNTPRLLLGRFYQESDIGDRKIYHKQKMRFILCPFTDMVDLVKSKDFFEISNSIYEEASAIEHAIKNNPCPETKTLFGFPIDVLTVLKIWEYQMQYATIWCLLLRLWVAHNELTLYVDSHPKHALRLQLFIDSHINLCSYILRSKQFEDSELLDPRNNHDSVAVCAVRQYCPNNRDFAYAGNLPNMTSCMFVGNLYYDVRPKPKTVALPHALIHIFACKTQPQKCQLRNFVNILYKYVEKFPIIAKLYREIVRVSLLGNYEHARVRPHFELRMKIYEECNPANYNPTDFFHFLLDNDKMIFQMTKEFHMFTVESDLAIDDLMQEKNPSWKNIKGIVCDAMDICRSILKMDAVKNRCFGWKTIRQELLSMRPELLDQTRAWKQAMDQIKRGVLNEDSSSLFVLMHDQMTFSHNRSKQISCAKLRKGSYLDVIGHYIDVFFETKITDQNSTKQNNSEMHFSKAMIERINLVARSIVHQHSNGKLKDGKVPLFYLKAFAISKEGYALLCKIEYLYEKHNVPDNAINKYLKFFYNSCKRDFHLFHVLLKSVIHYRMFKRHALSLDYYQNQRRALLVKRFKMPWQDFEAHDDIYYYCPTCKKFKNSACDSNSNFSPKNIYAQGCENAVFDLITKKLYCTKKSIPQSIKNSIDSGVYESGEKISDRSLAKLIRKHKEAVQCSETELIGVHMCGWVQQLQKRKWILCSICAQPTIFETCKFGDLGVTCGLHSNPELITKQKTDRYTILAPNSLEYQMRLTRYPLPIYQEPSNDNDFFALLKNQIAYTRQLQHYHDHYRKNFCYYCKCSLTFQPTTKTSKSTPINFANSIFLMEDRTIEQIQHSMVFQDPLFSDVVPIPENATTVNRWNFSNLENSQQFRIVNVFLCNKDFKKIEYALQDDYIRTTSRFIAEMQKINADAFKRQQRIQSRAYGFERKT
jgi:hypothetical protein